MTLIEQISSLLNAGYTREEIDQMLNAGTTSAELPPADASGSEPTPQPDPAASPEPTEDEHKEIDDLKEQISKLQSDLAAAQKINTGRDLSTEPSDQDTLNDIARSYM